MNDVARNIIRAGNTFAGLPPVGLHNFLLAQACAADESPSDVTIFTVTPDPRNVKWARWYASDPWDGALGYSGDDMHIEGVGTVDGQLPVAGLAVVEYADDVAEAQTWSLGAGFGTSHFIGGGVCTDLSQTGSVEALTVDVVSGDGNWTAPAGVGVVLIITTGGSTFDGNGDGDYEVTPETDYPVVISGGGDVSIYYALGTL